MKYNVDIRIPSVNNICVDFNNNEYIPLEYVFEFMSNYTYKKKDVDNAPNTFHHHYHGLYESATVAIRTLHEHILDERYLRTKKILTIFKDWSRSLDEMLNYSGELTIGRRLRTADRYVFGRGFLGILNTFLELVPIYCAVVHKNNIVHLFNAILSEQEDLPNNKIEIWVDERLYKRGETFHDKIKAKVKERLVSFENEGIKVVRIKRNPLFNITMIPSFKNLNEKQEWIRKLYNKVKEEVGIKIEVNPDSITIPNTTTILTFTGTSTSTTGQVTSNFPH